MIEIQVNNLVKSFEVGKNVLDGLTFQVDQGERVGWTTTRAPSWWARAGGWA